MKFKELSSSDQQEIVEVLSQFGLNERDRIVYFALLESGEATITPIARKINFPVTTVQSILKKLDTLGLVLVTKRKTKHVYLADNPANLKKILEQKIKDLNNVIPFLKDMRSESSTAKINIYYKERMTDIFKMALEESGGDIYEIVSAKDLQFILGEKFHFTRRRVREAIHLKSLRVEKFEIKKYNKSIHEKELREAKFLPRELTFKTSLMIWKNKVAFFSSKDEGLAWVVESDSTAEMMKQIFNLLWDISRRMETI